MHSPHPQPPHERTTLRRKRRKARRLGRPRALDDVKQREACALIAGGCGFREAARYVNCNVGTIRREADRNPAFAEQLRNSEAYAQVSPLKAMQQAAGTHWRAAAWMLERAFPDRFSRPEPGAFGARQARQLMNEVLTVISSELPDPLKYSRVEKRIRGTFEYHIRVATDRRRTTQNLRRAMSFLEDRDRLKGPLAKFGIPTPDIDFSKPPAAPVRRGFSDAAATPTEGLPQPSLHERPLRKLTALLWERLCTGRGQNPEPAAASPDGLPTSPNILQQPSTTEPQ